MHLEHLRAALAGLPIGEIRYFDIIGSTNEYAAEWALSQPPDFSLVIADEQTAGRGRLGRKWHTPPRSALALSLILHPERITTPNIAFFTGLASLAVCQSLQELYQLPSAIKWPNDVLVHGKKVAGVLVEAHWLGEQAQALIIGLGLNVTARALPEDVQLNFPAASLEQALGIPVDRLHLLRSIIERCLYWRKRLDQPAFLHAWRAHLAFLNQTVIVHSEGRESLIGSLRGLDDQARLIIETGDGQLQHLHAGEIQLRPVVDTSTI